MAIWRGHSAPQFPIQASSANIEQPTQNASKNGTFFREASLSKKPGLSGGVGWKKKNMVHFFVASIFFSRNLRLFDPSSLPLTDRPTKPALSKARRGKGNGTTYMCTLTSPYRALLRYKNCSGHEGQISLKSSLGYR